MPKLVSSITFEQFQKLATDATTFHILGIGDIPADAYHMVDNAELYIDEDTNAIVFEIIILRTYYYVVIDPILNETIPIVKDNNGNLVFQVVEDDNPDPLGIILFFPLSTIVQMESLLAKQS